MTAPFSFVDPATRTPLVLGEDELRREGGIAVRTTTYRDPAHAVIGRETCRYDATTLALEAFTFEDLQLGERSEVTVRDGRAAVSYRDGAGAGARTAEIAWSTGACSPRLLGDLIVSRWDELRKTGELSFEMYVPFLLQTVGFRLRMTAGTEDGSWRVRAEPKGFVLRRFVPRIEVSFADADDGGGPRLVGYKGPAAVAIGGVRFKPIEVVFQSGAAPLEPPCV